MSMSETSLADRVAAAVPEFAHLRAQDGDDNTFVLGVIRSLKVYAGEAKSAPARSLLLPPLQEFYLPVVDTEMTPCS